MKSHRQRLSIIRFAATDTFLDVAVRAASDARLFDLSALRVMADSSAYSSRHHRVFCT
jgi:hypothetical protein